MTNPRLYTVHALAPIHFGTGQGAGGIDLPIARERPTGLPFGPGSTLKGVLRANDPAPKLPIHRDVFGSEQQATKGSEQAGAVQFSDALLAFLPVRSVRGTFAWVTSPYVLRRLARDAIECGVKLDAVAAPASNDEAKVTGGALVANNRMAFEDFAFTSAPDNALKAVAAKLGPNFFAHADDQQFFTERVCLVTDDVMSVLMGMNHTQPSSSEITCCTCRPSGPDLPPAPRKYA